MKTLYIILGLVLLSSIVSAGWFQPDMPPPKVCGAVSPSAGRWMYINMEQSISNPVLWDIASSPDNPYVYTTMPGRIYIITSGEVP